MSNRTIQDIFDEERENDNIIEEIKNDIKNLQIKLQKELESYIKKQKDLSAEKKLLMIDLIKDNKIIWIDCNIEDWKEYVNNTGAYNSIYYKFYFNGTIEKQGYFKGYSYLNENDIEHFNKYIYDYFYYGYPLYYDKKTINIFKTDCELAFSNGTARLERILW